MLAGRISWCHYRAMRVPAGLLVLVFLLPAAHAQQLLVMQRNYASANGLSPIFFRDCVEVRTDDTYRFEHIAETPGQKDHFQIHVGKLSDDQGKNLRQILDETALRALTTPRPAPGSVAMGTDIDILWVAIARDTGPQMLFFDSTSSTARRASAASRLPSLYQTPAMKPLVNWYKQMSKQKNDIDKTATPGCSFRIKSD